MCSCKREFYDCVSSVHKYMGIICIYIICIYIICIHMCVKSDEISWSCIQETTKTVVEVEATCLPVQGNCHLCSYVDRKRQCDANHAKSCEASGTPCAKTGHRMLHLRSSRPCRINGSTLCPQTPSRPLER